MRHSSYGWSSQNAKCIVCGFDIFFSLPYFFNFSSALLNEPPSSSTHLERLYVKLAF